MFSKRKKGICYINVHSEYLKINELVFTLEGKIRFQLLLYFFRASRSASVMTVRKKPIENVFFVARLNPKIKRQRSNNSGQLSNKADMLFWQVRHTGKSTPRISVHKTDFISCREMQTSLFTLLFTHIHRWISFRIYTRS